MSSSAMMATAILVAVSLLVRIVPAFVRLPLSAERSVRIEAVLPVAVLINLAVFSAASELAAQRTQAAVGLLTLGALCAWRRVPVIVAVLLASVAYAAARALA